jgi:hypothetical protein
VAMTLGCLQSKQSPSRDMILFRIQESQVNIMPPGGLKGTVCKSRLYLPENGLVRHSVDTWRLPETTDQKK